MQITFEVELDYGDDGPGDDTATPTPDDIQGWIANGIKTVGMESPMYIKADQR